MPSNRTILLVDNDSSALSLYSSRLEQAGFKTASAFDVAQACEALPTLTVDLIIVDLMLPRRGSLDLLKVIRSDTRYKDTPILILSNTYLPEMCQRALRAGGSKALARSECTSSELISVSRALLGEAGANGFSSGEDTAAATLAEQLIRDLMHEGDAEIAAIRQHWFKYAQTPASEDAQECFQRIYQSLRLLSTRAGLAGCGKIAQLSGAVEAMLFEHLSRSNAALSPSSTQTLIQAVDCLGGLLNSGTSAALDSSGTAKVLLVDDDEVCNMGNEVALKRANYHAVKATSGTAALDLLHEENFELVLLDIEMPGMDGIEV